jgi:hypothetical protein
MRSAFKALVTTSALVAGVTFFGPVATASAASPCGGNIVEGDSGSCVVGIQQMLSDWGFGYDLGPGGIDGQFGQDTYNAVRAFQTAAGIGVDGQVGPQTSGALWSAGSNGPGHSRHVLRVDERIGNTGYLRCLQENGSSTSASACTSSIRQIWDIYPVPYHNGSYTLASEGVASCLLADGPQVDTGYCDGGTSEKWTFGPDSLGRLTLHNVNQGLCVDTIPSGQSNQPSEMNGCDNSATEAWYQV